MSEKDTAEPTPSSEDYLGKKEKEIKVNYYKQLKYKYFMIPFSRIMKYLIALFILRKE